MRIEGMVGERPLRLVIAGGGTGGHVQPARAVLEELRRRNIAVEPLWIGSADGLEREAAAKEGIRYRAIPTGKLRRYLDWRTPLDAARIPLGIGEAWRHLRRFRPDVVFSTGGFVSVPSVVAAARLAPILTHEQTATLGLATRINARFADVVALSWTLSLKPLHGLRCRVVVTGNPVRSSLAEGDAERARFRYGFRPDLPFVYVTGGARGASPLNERIAALLPGLLERCQVLHQTGPDSANADAVTLRRARDTWPPELRARYQVVEFVGEELADVYAAVDLVVGRAGAGTVAELACFGLPAVLVPLPGTGGDEQTRNARMLAEAGGAVLLPQDEATPERLREVLLDLLAAPGRRVTMATSARAIGRPDAAGRLVDELLGLAGRLPAESDEGTGATTSEPTEDGGAAPDAEQAVSRDGAVE
jgi:UDP-N-acetylglucosamine--N-acetylmuramyl-(pentapeptide) pyrophosphoryl-undecaprenol N-acetylglucosamine transferase